MVRITPENQVWLDNVVRVKKAHDLLTISLKVELEAQFRAKLQASTTQLETTLAQAAESGLSIRQLGIAYGSSDFRTVKNAVESGRRHLAYAPATPPPPSPTTTPAHTPPEGPTHPNPTVVPTTVPGFETAWHLTWPDGADLRVALKPDGTHQALGTGEGRARWVENPELAALLTPA